MGRDLNVTEALTVGAALGLVIEWQAIQEEGRQLRWYIRLAGEANPVLGGSASTREADAACYGIKLALALLTERVPVTEVRKGDRVLFRGRVAPVISTGLTSDPVSLLREGDTERITLHPSKAVLVQVADWHGPRWKGVTSSGTNEDSK
jgi:hypothetical protein